MDNTTIITNNTSWTYRCWIWRHLDGDPVLFQACLADVHLAQALLIIPEDWPRWTEGQVAPGGASWGLGERGRHVATAAHASVAENKNTWSFKKKPKLWDKSSKSQDCSYLTSMYLTMNNVTWSAVLPTCLFPKTITFSDYNISLLNNAPPPPALNTTLGKQNICYWHSDTSVGDHIEC